MITILNIKQTADFLHISKDTIYSLVRQGKIPHSRLGDRKILFIRETLEKWLEDQVERSIQSQAIEEAGYGVLRQVAL